MSKVDLVNSPIVQSPYTYLQAAGSDASDRTIQGNQLRWDFLKTLGDNHLAKGNFTTTAPYISTLGFNRPNDFIKIFRTKFKNKYFTKIDFKVNQTTVVNTGTTRAWQYALPVNGLTGVTRNVTVRFIDYTQYDIIRAAQSTFKTIDLLNAYTGIVEVETDGKLFFYSEFDIKFKGAGYLRVESVTIPDTSDFTQKQVSCRKKFTGGGNKIISCENIQYLRFDYLKTEWNEIRVYCYEDYIEGINTQNEAGNWDLVGNFHITTDDTTVTNRFRPADVDGAGGHWPKFNDDNPVTGAFTIRRQNYYKRWRRLGYTFDPATGAGDPNGLQYFIHKYMELSKTDERALASIPSDVAGDPTTQDISYIDMIRLMSLDYHVARGLGLGHIDDDRQINKEPYIYCLEYKTFVKLEAPFTTNVERTHIYMTPPVSFSDYKLPAKPSLTPLTYGISVNNGTPNPTLLTDANGYAPFGNVRFININRGPFNFEKPFGPFYWDPTEFCLCDETQPIAYGLEYKEIGEATYRKPEISNDSEYFDTSGLAETIPILEGGTPKIFTHQEVEEGTHEYRSYAINWFSRVSDLSNPVQAITAFPKKSNLLPPFNFAVQLIQDEDPAELNIPDKSLVLTTQAEQNILSVIPTASDKTLVRTTFDWNHIHHHAHQYADYADILYRRKEPMVVKGKIASVSLLPGNRAQITTTSYSITSTFPATTIVPSILSGDATKFVDSFFSSGGDNYVIESVISSGANPSFIIKSLKQINAVADPANPGQFISNETFKSPLLNDLFFTAENMGAVSNWDLRHSKRIYLEKFYSNAKVKLRFSPTHTVNYDIKTVALGGGGNTRIEVEKPISTGLIAGLTLEYSVKHEIVAIAANTFTISGDITSDFTTGKQFRVFANKANDKLYSVSSSSFVSGNTLIITNETIPDITNIDGLIEIVVSRPVTAINNANNTFRITGNKIAEINAASLEYKLETDGSLSRFVVGGINDMVTFEPFLTTPPPASGILPEGTGYIQLKFQNYDLLPHPDSEVSWYKGTVRLKDVSNNVQVYPVTFIGNLSSTGAPHLAIVIQDPGFVPKSAQTGASAADIYTLDLGVSQQANYHPAYKLYLTADNGINPTTGLALPPSAVNFDSDEILPTFSDPNEGSRQTFMAIRSYDVKNDLESFLSNPVVLLAQKISPPKIPGTPQGPLYATRPDFYGKSTYTFDTQLDILGGRIPYSVVFYKTSADRVFDVLYKKTTQASIWAQLDLLVDPLNPNAIIKHDPQLWAILFDGQSSGANFAPYNISSVPFIWPLPDNDEFFLVYETNKDLSNSNPLGGHVLPFKSTFNFNFTGAYTIYGKPWTPQQILKRAIQDAFLSLTEQPPMYSYFKTGTQTSAAKAKSRDANGNILDPIANDIFPMIKKLPSFPGKVRFTDFTLDGASKSLYFYRALEMDDKFKFSDASTPVGPVLMVNAFSPDRPQVKTLITKRQNVTENTKTSVLFEINEYSSNEKISKIEIYRATNEIDALSIRTMKKANSIIWGNPLVDDFSDVAFPLYGEKIYYRLIAIREVEDVEDILLAPAPIPNAQIPTVIVDLPSLPSEISKTEIVDVINPPAPILYSENGNTTATELQDVILKWNPTCYNGKYSLQKLTINGNWVEIYNIKVTDTPMQYPPLDFGGFPDFSNFSETQILPRIDSEGNPIFHKFRVQVENSSELFNVTEYELALAKGCSDLQHINNFLSFSDSNGHAFSSIKNENIISGVNYPNSFTFVHINTPLPAGHNNFVKIDITIVDDLSNSATLTINFVGGNVVFDGLTAPSLDLQSPNRIYTISSKLFTDYCTSGFLQECIVKYLTGPCYDLSQINRIIKIEDSNHIFNPALDSDINEGVSYPLFLKLTDISDLSGINETFDHIDVTITDDLSNTSTLSILSAGGNVIFDSSTSLVLDSSNPNRTYNISLTLYSLECVLGSQKNYLIKYTHV